MAEITVFSPTFHVDQFPSLDIRPEVMAAIKARFSRTPDGLAEILMDVASIDEHDAGQMAKRILKFIDYGHASIGGLTGAIPVGFDKVSMLAPFLPFLLQAKQDGQETSTRYCEFTSEGLAHPDLFGVPRHMQPMWYDVMTDAFDISGQSWAYLDARVKEDPSIARIPAGVAPKVADRMRRNYGFDRARYTLPLAALTNFGINMTAREWADTLKYLSASPIREISQIADATREKLTVVTPNMMKHSHPTAMSRAYMNDFFERGAEHIRKNGVNTAQLPDEVVTDVTLPQERAMIDSTLSIEDRLAKAYAGKENRYDIARGYPEKIHVSVYWNNMAFAELRDMNRQRPCKKDVLFAPHGFYMAPEMKDAITALGLTDRHDRFQNNRAVLLRELANSSLPSSYVSAMMLGDQMPFEMHTDAAHMTYVIELRTGSGVHFRYDEHTRQAYEGFAKQCPAWTKHVTLGTAEPE
jgi:thymidylate synthase ThyX